MNEPRHGRRDSEPDPAPSRMATEAGDRRRDAAPEASVRPAPLGTGAQVGPYRVLELLGEGGMGRVYLAEQRAPLVRRVALKLIRATVLDDRLLRRFRDEGLALARMSHPAIAQVFEAGTSDHGEPFIAMEHVAGLPITDYADQHRLTLRQRLGLFVDVCDGIQHAHEKAVIHRDIKPSNVLVAEAAGGRRPMPKIIDFGIAKALDRPAAGTRLTQRWIGTPAYLSPEAVEADEGIVVDTRSDIYSLGVLLFALLTGGQPFGSGSSVSVLRRIVEQEVPRPSRFVRQLAAADRAAAACQRRLEPAALERALRGDLDWIVLQAMARERGNRYPSAAELSADVRRHLEHRPVLVRPPSPIYRARKWLRRHLAAAVAATLVFLSLGGGMVARSLEARRANREAARANLQAAAAQQVSDFLVGLFRGADPASTDASADVTATELLDRGVERLRTELADQPLPRSRLLATIGSAYRELGAFAKAEPLLEEALELRRAHLPADDPEVVDSALALGSLHVQTRRLDRAEPLLRRALELLDRTPGTSDAAAGGERSALRARALMELASVDAHHGRLERAEQRLTEVVALREALLGADHPGLAAALNNLANIYYDLERFEDAEGMHLRAIAIKEKALGPEHFHLAQSYNNLANVYLARGELERARPLHERSLAIKRTVLPADHPEIGVSLHNLGNLAFELGEGDHAERLQLEAMAVFEASLPSDHPFLGYPGLALGKLAHRKGRLDEAAARLRRALAIFEPRGTASAEWREAASALIEVLVDLGAAEEAESLRARLAADDAAP